MRRLSLLKLDRLVNYSKVPSRSRPRDVETAVRHVRRRHCRDFAISRARIPTRSGHFPRPREGYAINFKLYTSRGRYTGDPSITRKAAKRERNGTRGRRKFHLTRRARSDLFRVLSFVTLWQSYVPRARRVSNFQVRMTRASNFRKMRREFYSSFPPFLENL